MQKELFLSFVSFALLFGLFLVLLFFQQAHAGFLEDGTLFDSSIEEVCKTFGKFDAARAEAKGYQPIPFQAGRKDGMIPGFIEGIEKLSFGDKAVLFIPAHLAYGEAGAGGVIPPNANIIFEVQLLEKPQ